MCWPAVEFHTTISYIRAEVIWLTPENSDNSTQLNQFTPWARNVSHGHNCDIYWVPF